MIQRFALTLALFALLCLWGGLPRLSAQVQLGTKGDNFWFGYMDNSIERAIPNLWIHIAVPMPETGTPSANPVKVYLNVSSINVRDTFEVEYGKTYTVVFPTSDRGSNGRPVGLPDDNKGIHKLYDTRFSSLIMNVQPGAARSNAINIQSSDDINVFVLNQRPFTTDATIIYPTGVLASDYTVQAYDEIRTSQSGDPSDPTNVRADWLSQFMIVAPAAMEVTIESPSAAVLGRRTPAEQTIRLRDGKTLTPGERLVVQLDAGQTYLVQSNQDLTGCRVYVDGGGICTGFAVFGGNQCATVGDCAACDHLFEMLLPSRDASNSHILVGTRRRTQEIYRVAAREDGTTVTLHTAPPVTRTLDAGEFTNFRIRTAFGISGPGDAAYMLTSDKPVTVTQNGMGLYCDQQNWEAGYGDPYTLTMPGADLMIAKSATVMLIDYPSSRMNANPARRRKWEHYLNILTKTELVNYVRIDGKNTFRNYWQDGAPETPIKDNFKPVAGFPEYSWTSILYDVSRMTEQDESIALKITLEDETGQREFGLTDGFAAYVVGYLDFDSYGYTAAVGMNQVARMEGSELGRVHNMRVGETKGEYSFRVKGGFTQKTDIPRNPENPSETVNEDSYKFKLINKDTEETIENPAVYFLSGFGDNRVAGYPSGLALRLVGLAAGNYQLVVEDYDVPTACEQRLDFEITEPVSRSARAVADLGLTVYPNPGEGLYQVRLRQETGGEVEFQLFDLQGRVVWSRAEFGEREHATSVDLSRLPAGAYLLKVRTSQGFQTARIVQQ